MKPNRDAFNHVCADLEKGIPLTFRMIGEIFGHEFWELVVVAMSNINLKTDGRIEVHFHGTK